MRANLLPGLVLQGFALALLVGYLQSPAVRAALDQLGALKQAQGYLYSAVATALFGGVIPFVTLWAYGRIPRERAVAEGLFYVGFWIWKGVEVDALYRGQALLLGEHGTLGVIAAKTALDQFVYNPLWAVPTQALCFAWKDAGFSLAATRRALRERSLLHRGAVILCSGWVVWIPAVSLIYALPSALQIPLFNLVLCFWCLLLTFVARDTGTAAS